MATVLDIDTKIIDTIQDMINSFVLDIKPGGRHWISKDLLYEPTKKGGFGIIKLADFTRAIKCSWIKRYCVDQLDDHLADLLDKHFSLTPNTRKNILTYGPERFNEIIIKNIPGISSISAAYKAVKANFPTTPDTLDNSWLCFTHSQFVIFIQEDYSSQTQH